MPRRVWLLAAGALALAFAGGPLHSLDSASLPAHMAEHGVLLFVAPLLLALGYPILGRLRFRDAGPEWLAALVGLAFAHAAAMIVWHLPPAFDAAERSEALHVLEHVSMLVIAYAFWAVLIAPKRSQVMTLPVLFATSMAGVALGVTMMLSTRPWYVSPASVIGQQVGGVVMWAIGGTAMLVVAAWELGRWLHERDVA